MKSNNPNPEQQELSLFNEIKKEFSIESSKEVLELVASVLQSFRQTLTLQNATELINRLPDMMKVIFVTNWRHDEEPVRVDHLDELVGLVMKRDSLRSKTLFKNEIQTLSVIIVTLKRLFKMVDIENFTGLSPAFRQELNQVQTEAA